MINVSRPSDATILALRAWAIPIIIVSAFLVTAFEGLAIPGTLLLLPTVIYPAVEEYRRGIGWWRQKGPDDAEGAPKIVHKMADDDS